LCGTRLFSCIWVGARSVKNQNNPNKKEKPINFGQKMLNFKKVRRERRQIMSVLYGNGFIGVDIAYDEDCISPIGWGRMLAHVHKIIGGPFNGKWFWSVPSHGCEPIASGLARSQVQAKRACHRFLYQQLRPKASNILIKPSRVKKARSTT
jgi:hypothetical protein